MFLIRCRGYGLFLFASTAACLACDSAGRPATAPTLQSIAISPKRASVPEFLSVEFVVALEPPRVQATWQCTLSDAALGTVRVSNNGCVFTAARGSHLGTLTVRSGELTDLADVVVVGTGASR